MLYEAIFIAIGLIVGIFLGIIMNKLINKKRTANGTLKIDYSDPERDLFRLELNYEPDELATKKKVILNVDVKRKF